MKTVSQVRRICDPFDTVADTDCVGLSHILYYTLTYRGVRPALFMRCDWNNPAVCNRVTGVGFSHHMWLVLDTREGSAIIDYRAREWVGSIGNTPHGVFLKSKYPHMAYVGHKMDPIYSDWSVMWVADPERYPHPDDAVLEQLEEEAARGPMREWEERDGGRFFPSGFHRLVGKAMQQGRR